MKVPVRVSLWAGQYEHAVWYTVTIFGIVIIGGLWWGFVYQPIGRLLNGYASHTESLKTTCAYTTECIQLLRTAELNVSRLQLDLEQKESTGESGIDWISKVIHKAQQEGLAIVGYQVDAECAKNFYNCAQSRFEFTGTLDQITKTIGQLITLHSLVGCKQWSLIAGDNNLYHFSCVLYKISFLDCACVQERKTPSTYSKLKG